MAGYNIIILKYTFDLITLLAVIASSLVLLVLVVLVVVAIICRRKKRQRAAVEIKHSDENPVYGMYYFATGDHIDESNSEVVDSNDYYG